MPQHPSGKQPVVALVGNPNTGKTTLFNALTGFRGRVGNYAGVTVERKTGLLRTNLIASPVEIIDLPGAYSLAANSADEAVVLDALCGHYEEHSAPDVIVVVVDATQLARSLFFVSQILEIGHPTLIALNMVDLADHAGIDIDADSLAKQVGVPVISVVANRRTGLESLITTIGDTLQTHAPALVEHRLPFPECIQEELAGLTAAVADNANPAARGSAQVELLQALLEPEGYHESVMRKRHGDWISADLESRRERIRAAGVSLAQVEAGTRYDWVGKVLAQTVRCSRPDRRPRSEKADVVLTHPVWGLAIVAVLMAGCFQAIYVWAAPIMDAVDIGVTASGGFLRSVVPSGAIQSFLVDGVVAGVGGVLIFLPQILILFLFIAILEDCGFMPRVALLLDRWMRRLGLNGQSFIPLLSSFACAVPGILATRTIANRRDRFVTMLIAPLMSCSARLPVYVLLISAFVPPTPLLGGFLGLQTVVLLTMYVIGGLVAVAVALALKATVLQGKPAPFLMELPGYKWPSAPTVLHRMYEQGKVFCVSAGTIIFAVTIVIWALAYYPRPASIFASHAAMRTEAKETHRATLAKLARRANPAVTPAELPAQRAIATALTEIEAREAAFTALIDRNETQPGSTAWETARSAADADIAGIARQHGTAGEIALALHESRAALNDRLAEIDRAEAGSLLRQSILGRAGRWIEPAVRPLGWDWRIGTAVIASFPAREVVIATLGTLYNLGGDQSEASEGLRAKLRTVTGPDGQPTFGLPVALSIMVFFALCCQCAATLAAIKRETNSWRWPILTFSYMTVLAYIGALVTYQIASRMI